MKIICEGIELSDSLMKVVKACATKTTTLILECVKLSAKNDTLTLLATDGEISIRRDIRAEVLEEGAVCVPGKYFADFIKRLENEQITLATDGSQMQITYGEAQSALQTLNADDFPAIDTDISEKYVKLSARDLKELIAKTTFCCAQDDSRPVLRGCLIAAEGGSCAALATGGRTAAALAGDFPFLGEREIIRIGDFIYTAVNAAKKAGLKRLIVGCMAGKLFKYACGERNTHAHKAAMMLPRLREIVPELPADVELEHFSSMGELASALPPDLYRTILLRCRDRAMEYLAAWGGNDMKTEIALYQDSGERLL